MDITKTKYTDENLKNLPGESDDRSIRIIQRTKRYLKGQWFNIMHTLDKYCEYLGLEEFNSDIYYNHPIDNQYIWNIELSVKYLDDILYLLSVDNTTTMKNGIATQENNKKHVLDHLIRPSHYSRNIKLNHTNKF